MQLLGKLMNQTWKITKKPNLGPNFGSFDHKSGLPKLFFAILPLTDVMHCCKQSFYAISRKTNVPNLRKWQNLISGQIVAGFGPNLIPQFFLWVLPSLDVINCCKLSLYAIARKTNEPNLRKWKKKTLVFDLILAPLAQIWNPKIFFVDFSSTRC